MIVLMELQTLAEWLVALATLAALLVAAVQLRHSRAASAESFARQMWTDYLTLGLANPDLGETRVAMQEHQFASVEALVSGDTIASQRYIWFLTVMLDACETIDNYLPRGGTWTLTALQQIGYHRDALRVLRETDQKGMECYGKRLRDMIDKVLDTDVLPASGADSPAPTTRSDPAHTRTSRS